MFLKLEFLDEFYNVSKFIDEAHEELESLRSLENLPREPAYCFLQLVRANEVPEVKPLVLRANVAAFV